MVSSIKSINNRIEWVDIFKEIEIILVALGSLSSMITASRRALFFFLWI